MIPELTPFYRATDDPSSVALDARETHHSVIGTLCSYAPEELIFAAGCHPMRLFPSKGDIQLADNHLQAYCCSLVRGILEDGLAGRLDFLSGIVFPHTCDSIQRLSDIWRMNLSFGFFADVILPAKLDTDASRTYMTRVLERFKADLEAYTEHPVTEEALKESIALFNRIRSLLGRVYDLQSQSPGLIRARDLFTVIKAAMLMDRRGLARHLAALIKAMEAAVPPPTTPKRLILSGSACDMPDLYSLIESAGGAVVGDDLCSGQRGFDGTIPEDIPALEGLTVRYADRTVCPAKHRGNTARSEALIALVKQRKADGVVFTQLKFCDPHAFDTPYLAGELDREGIRHLHLEMDAGQDGSGQMATRIETFIHTI